MSFRRDLERFAAMEWARRHPANRRSIEALLYPPHRSERQHAKRAGIPPIIGIGVPVEPLVIVDLISFMETGMCHVVSFAEATFDAEIVLPDNARDRYNSAAAPDYRTWLDWLIERNGSLGNITRVNADSIPSMSMVNRADYDNAVSGWAGAPTGKKLLLWQAQLGLLSPSAPPYDGPTIPST